MILWDAGRNVSGCFLWHTRFTVGCSRWIHLHEWQKEEGQKRSCFCQLVRVKVRGMLQIWCCPGEAYKGTHTQWKPVMHRVFKTNSAWVDCWSLCTELFPESKCPCTSPQFLSAQSLQCAGLYSSCQSWSIPEHGALVSSFIVNVAAECREAVTPPECIPSVFKCYYIDGFCLLTKNFQYFSLVMLTERKLYR